MGVLSFLMGRGAAEVGAARTPMVFSPTINAPATYEPEPVVYSEEESNRIQHGPPPKVRALFNKWIGGASTCVRRYKYQPYFDDGNYGSIWVQFTTSTKQYNYPNVPWTEFVAMIKAASRGNFVNDVLRRLYSVGYGRYWTSRPGHTPHYGRRPATRRKSWR